jgi:hypothetical protein
MSSSETAALLKQFEEMVIALGKFTESIQQEREAKIIAEAVSKFYGELAAVIRGFGIKPTEIPPKLQQAVFREEYFQEE